MVSSSAWNFPIPSVIDHRRENASGRDGRHREMIQRILFYDLDHHTSNKHIPCQAQTRVALEEPYRERGGGIERKREPGVYQIDTPVPLLLLLGRV